MSNGIIPKLCAIQSALKSPKDQKAQKYRYRNIEAVNEAVKPLAAAQGCAVIYSDTLEVVEGQTVCTATCTLTDGDESVSAQAFALVNTRPQNMSIEQACGAASSYARKYSACGLFAIDDSRDDPDARAPKPDAPDGTDGRLADAKRSLAEACRCYAERYGLDPDEVMRGVSDRADYAEGRNDPAWFLAVADEFMSS